MHRYRPIHHSLAFLVVALGIAGVPAAALADDGTSLAEPAEGTTASPQPAAPSLPAVDDDDPAPTTTPAPEAPRPT